MSNKSISVTIIIVIAVAAGIALFRAQPADQNGAPNGTADWKTYRNAGIELQYPSDLLLQEYKDQDTGVVRDVRFVGDGFTFIINPDGAFGEFEGFSPKEITVAGQTINAGEQVDSDDSYHLVFTLERPNRENFYFFRINVDSIFQPLFREKIAAFLDSVKLIEKN